MTQESMRGDVIPLYTGIQESTALGNWTPAYAGVTRRRIRRGDAKGDYLREIA
ncbi:MAG: hypothetical protein ACXWUU_12320 [Burkholderiales bacterium]